MPAWLIDILTWLRDFILWVPRRIWDELMQAMAALINAIPVPDFITTLGAQFASIVSGFGYFFDVLQVHIGIPMVLGAYLLRFLIRRIPIIG